jgi:peroxiredoxin
VNGVRRSGRFPGATLPDLDGAPRSLAEAWRDGDALVLIGHRTCKTTRQTLPYVDRLWRRRAAGHEVVAVLQDTPEEARELARTLSLEMPLRLEADPYPLAQELGLTTVPTLFLLDRDGQIRATSEGFSRADLESFAQRLGVPAPLFTPEDKAPAMKPG